ncbi:biotin carboxylase [Stutzerimonas stutzeri]|nr:biotin carboxylase [Stutzerimonas stutzeri]
MLAAVYSGTPCYRSGGSERHGFAAGVHVEQSMELSTKMMNAQTLQGSRRVVLTYPNRPREPQHEKIVHAALAERLAVLLGLSYGGEYDPTRRYDAHPYLVPSGTVVGLHEAHELGLNEEGDLFGGVVPQPFVETKAITHPLVRPDAVAPVGWSRDFGTQVKGSVLAGYSAFSLEDARDAGRRLLHEGAVRIKPVRATGGRGQLRVDDSDALDQALFALDEKELGQYGVVLEAHLERVTTFSVGQVRVGGRLVSYYGTQRLTRDNAGNEVYGGSDLVVVDGDFEALLALDLPETTRLAVSQAQVYDEAASSCYRHFFASRRNYDIAQGIDGRGQPRSGVLEQSWRIGGASSAEIAALEAFRRGSAVRAVKASSIELYGEQQQVPAGAQVLYRDEDAEVGFITKCVMVEDYGDA